MAAQIPGYDYIVIGSGLSGLFLAAQLSQHTSRVLLVDEADQFGGSHRTVPHELGPLNGTLQYFPWTQDSEQALLAIEDFLGIKLLNSVLENQVLTYEKGEFKPFIGFGNQAPDFFSELSPYLASQRMNLHLEWGDVLQLLRDKFKGDLVQRNVVTGFDFAGDQVQGVILNGAKKIASQNIIYCGSLKRLYPLVHLNTEISGKVKTKLSKGPYWSVLRLDLLFHKQLTESNQLFLLSGASQDDLAPCIGRFLPAQATGQASQWMTFLPSLEAEESELVGEAIKKIKRHVKRAFFSQEESTADFQKQLSRERITWHEYHLGNDLKIESNLFLPGTIGLWMGSSQLSPERGPLAGIVQGVKVLKAMGFYSAAAVISETSSDAITSVSP